MCFRKSYQECHLTEMFSENAGDILTASRSSGSNALIGLLAGTDCTFGVAGM